MKLFQTTASRHATSQSIGMSVLPLPQLESANEVERWQQPASFNPSQLPAAVGFMLCSHLGWRDIMSLEQCTLGWRSELANEPLIWVTQLLKHYPRHLIPKSVMHWMSSPLSPGEAALDWRDIFMGLRRVQPAAACMQRPLVGYSPVFNSMALVEEKGSDYQQVLRICKRASFVTNFESLPAGKYTVLWRVKVAKGRRGYVNFSAFFSRPGGTDGADGVADVSVASEASAAGDNSGLEGGFDVPAAADLWQPHALSAAAALEGAASAGSELDDQSERSSGTKRWLKWRPNFQILMGSFSASWYQVGRLPSADSPLLRALLGRSKPTATDAGAPVAAANAAAASAGIALSSASRHSHVAGGVRQQEPDADGWLTVPVGTVTLRSTCCVRLTFVALGTSVARGTDPALPDPGSMHVDYVSLQPAGACSGAAAAAGSMLRGHWLEGTAWRAVSFFGGRESGVEAANGDRNPDSSARFRTGLKTAAAMGTGLVRTIARAAKRVGASSPTLVPDSPEGR